MGAYRELVSYDDLKTIMPLTRDGFRHAYVPYINIAMAEFHIDTRRRMAAFLGQIAVETGEMNLMEERRSVAWLTQHYELNRRKAHDLQNTQPGDGARYRGRGAIQLTGRGNYRRAGAALGLDLEGHPETAAHADVSFRIAGEYWTQRGINAFADREDYRGVTRLVNGKRMLALARRLAFTQRALATLREPAPVR